MKTLLVGDPHIQIQKLGDGKSFIRKLSVLAKDHERVIILGDLFHTFAVIRSEVMALWAEYFGEYGEKTVSLVGNHDYAGQRGGNHALEVFKYSGERIVEGPTVIDDIRYLPFMRDNSEFEESCKKIERGSVLICHQSFTGADFGNGFFAPDGASVDCVKHLKAVISGHIHRRQAFNNIWYPGVPYMHSFSEAGYTPRVFTIDLKLSGYQIIKEHDLELPQYVVIEAPIGELPDLLPTPIRSWSYKIVSCGTPAEIIEFWKNPIVRNFRSGARRVIDAITPERGELPSDIFGSHDTKGKKFEKFIQSRKWRTSTDSVSTAARAFVSF